MAGESTLIVTTRTGVRPLGVRGEPLHNAASQLRRVIRRRLGDPAADLLAEPQLHEDGYIELRDRSKDIIISGGENISTIEVEGVIIKHPAVANVAVVAKPDEKWGETPCAFVVLKPGASATADDIVKHCRANLASYKCPRHVVFRDLPMTSTGKVQKFVLRDWAKAV